MSGGNRDRINRLRSRSSSVSKFLGPFKNLRSHCRHLYNRCTCHIDQIAPSNGSNSSAEPNVLDQTTLTDFEGIYSKRCSSTQNIPPTTKCDECIQIQESLKYTDNLQQQKLVWYNCETGISLVNGMILPSPPPTPLFHPDGDFLLQVIPPPFEFQDKYNSSRPATSQHRHVNQSGDASGVFRSRSGTSVIGYSDELRQPMAFSAYTKYTKSSTAAAAPETTWNMTRPKFGFNLNESRCLNRSFCKISPALFLKQNFSCENERPLVHLQELSVTWKDLPKSISLNINSGFVESMFVPSWSNLPLRKAPFFIPIQKIVNWSAIDVRNERVGSRKQRILEVRTCYFEQRKMIWNCRRQIGLLRRKLLPEALASGWSFGGVEGTNDMSKKFQLIHRLSENETDINSTGRYFDVDDKRLVAIKISPANPPANVHERCKVKLEALREIQALKQLDHINIIGLLSYFEHMEKIHLVLEACDHTLRCEISCAGGSVDPKLALGVVYQIANGLDHCHKKSLLHRNLSPDTILVTVEGTIKISDFSKSTFLKGQKQKPWAALPGDFRYGAPELLVEDSTFGLSADVWSVGCILLELILGRLVWNGSTIEEQLLLIHKSVGPLLPQHVKAAGISDNVFASQALRDCFPDNCDKVLSLIELCLEVDFCKRIACRGLLGHPLIKLGRQYSRDDLPENALPRMALWEMRPHTSPLEKKSSDMLPELPRNPQIVADDSHTQPPPSMLRTRTAVIKSKPVVLFSQPEEVPKEKPVATVPTPKNNNNPTNHILFQQITKEQLYGLGSKFFWKNLNEIATHENKVHSGSGTGVQESSPILRKGNEVRKTDVRKPLENLTNSSNSELAVAPNCDSSMSKEITQCLPNGPRSRMQYLISSIPNASWNTVQVFTDHLVQSAKKNPKTFSSSVGQLVTVLLDQISDTKSKVAGPSIRILNNICEHNGSLFEPEAERIIESMLNKLGGPSFIEKESNDVLRNLTNTLKPCKAILSLIKFGINHKTSAARQSAILLIEEALQQIDLVSSFGLPGEQTAAQRRFSTLLFDVATKFLRDSNSQTRVAARGVYQTLMRHPGFWYIYQASVTEEKRHWVNRLLDEMRRLPAYEKKNQKPAVKTPCNY